ncbi:hypothetical protein [Methylobacter sp. sgz302048]|uniref:hypothetical protein n=1 Tax=Methylobacter sp. sgz302048 TaxID=3455945 RepID=UPI003F9F20F7
MKTCVQGASDPNGLVLNNPEQQLSPDIIEALSLRRAAHLDILELHNQSDLSPDIRKKLLESKQLLYRTVVETTGLDIEKFNAELYDIATEKNHQIANSLKLRINRWQGWRDRVGIVPPMVVVFPPPAVTDHSFWWAQTAVSSIAPDTRADFRDDGLHFFGGPKVNNYDGEMHTSFGATALFALQPERIPTSASGWFMSSPHVEIFGGIVAFAPDWDLIQGNGIASCNLVLRQTVFQWKFGQSGPVAGIVNQAESNEQWIYLKNTGYSRHANMPGFKPIPPVGFHESQFNRNEQLMAEIEVRFDIYLNTTGALLWCDPEVLLRNFQWPLVPV